EGPIGRRLLSETVQFTERSIRSEVEILKEAHLISTTKAGMLLTAVGLDTLIQLRELVEEENYLLELHNKVAKHLDNQSCSIVPGNFDKDYKILSKMAERTIEVINHLLGEGEQIIAVMGGTTLNKVANHMDANLGYNREL